MKLRNIICLGLLAATLGAAAQQQLSTEVVVNRDIAPGAKAAQRPDRPIASDMLQPAEPISLEPVAYIPTFDIPRDYRPLSPSPGAFAVEKSPFRGYVAAGYFPAVDFGATAGYRLIDKKNMSLAAYAGFADERYKPNTMPPDEPKHYFVNASAGLDFAWRPGKGSTLEAHAGYGFMRERSTYWYPQNVNSGRLAAKWSSKYYLLDYYAGLDVRFEQTSDTYLRLSGLGESPLIAGLGQQHWDASLGASRAFGASRVGLDLRGDFLHTTSTSGIFDFTPYYAYRAGMLDLRVGAKFDIAHRFGVMPDVRVALSPAKPFSLWVKFGGGSYNNTFAMLREQCVYQVFYSGFCRSKVPFSVEGGIFAGPFKNFSVGIFGGYAIADDWLMTAASALRTFMPVDIKGWHAGIKAEGEWRMISGHISADFAPSRYDRAWLRNRDRASAVVNAAVKVRVLEPLVVEGSYELRAHRRAFDSFSPARHELDLGNVSNLSLGAQWAFNKQLTAFARFENILCHRYMMVAWEPSRGLGGLFGVEYKF